VAYQPPLNGFRTFLILWATQAISVLGSGLTFFATTIWLTDQIYPRPEQKSQLAFALSAISLAFALPILVMGPIAGAWADRHDRKRTMLLADLASGLLSLLLAGLVAANRLQVPVLIGLTAVSATLTAFHVSAFDTSYAMLVPAKQLPRANGMMQTMWALSGILSPMLAAALISLPALARQGAIPGALGPSLGRLSSGTALAMTVDAITFFAAAAALPFLFIPSPSRTDLGRDGTGHKKSLWNDVKLGGLYIWQRRPLLWLLGTFTVANFVGGPRGVFQPLIVKFGLAPDWTSRGFTFETALALLATVGSIGGVVGGIAISAWGGLKKRRVYGVIVPLIAEGVALLVFGLSSALYVTAAASFVVSAMIPIMNSHSQAIWQIQTPLEMQGRVFAVRRVIAQCSWPLSTVLAGWAAGVFDPGAVIAFLAVILILFCVGQLFNPYLLQVEDKAFLDHMAAHAAAKSANL
jgi:MFS transporter, DHA3 family, macrolide efflux protein